MLLTFSLVCVEFAKEFDVVCMHSIELDFVADKLMHAYEPVFFSSAIFHMTSSAVSLPLSCVCV